MTVSSTAEAAVESAPARPLPARLPSLTGIRVILFTLAFFTHAVGAAYLFSDPKADRLATDLPDAIATLSLFFVLSGFVLTWQEPWNMTFGRFARKRVLKIFPSHVVTWAATIILLAVTPLTLIGPTSFGPALANLFLVQAWIPDPNYAFSVYGINWSVTADVLCYALLPLLIRPILRIPANRLWMWLVGCMVVIAVIPEAVMQTIHGAPWNYWAPLSFGQVDAVFLFPVTKVPEFLLGVILARMVQTGAWPRKVRAWHVWAATLVLWRVLLVLPLIYKSSGIMSITVCFFIPVLATRDIEGRTKWLNRRSMIILGDATYAAYLMQFPILGLAKTKIGATVAFGDTAGALVVLGLFVVNILVGLVLYKLVEQPVLRRFSTPGRRTTPVLAPAAGT